MAVLAASGPLGWPHWLPLTAAAPPLIATARARWPQVAGPDVARAGHALNAALGDAAGVAEPLVTGLLAAAVSPLAALWAMVPGPGIGALLLTRTPPAARGHAL